LLAVRAWFTRVLNFKKNKMSTKEKIEKELLTAMTAFDKMQMLVHELPEEEGYQDCFMSNLIDMKSKCKHFLNKHFDYLARQKNKNCAERTE
jgi:hypothetical protein